MKRGDIRYTRLCREEHPERKEKEKKCMKEKKENENEKKFVKKK